MIIRQSYARSNIYVCLTNFFKSRRYLLSYDITVNSWAYIASLAHGLVQLQVHVKNLNLSQNCSVIEPDLGVEIYKSVTCIICGDPTTKMFLQFGKIGGA